MRYHISTIEKIDHPLFDTYSVVDGQYTYDFDYEYFHKAIDWLVENDMKVLEIFKLEI